MSVWVGRGGGYNQDRGQDATGSDWNSGRDGGNGGSDVTVHKYSGARRVKDVLTTFCVRSGQYVEWEAYFIAPDSIFIHVKLNFFCLKQTDLPVFVVWFNSLFLLF